MNFDELFSNLSAEQKEAAKKCKTSEEFMNFIKSEGIDLTDEQMNAISGGKDFDWHCNTFF